jgi:hypothetical protein
VTSETPEAGRRARLRAHLLEVARERDPDCAPAGDRPETLDMEFLTGVCSGLIASPRTL